MSRLPAAVRRRVRERAGGLCEYCLTFSDLTGHAFTVDHIIPQSRRGTSELDNLCLCCFWCNDYKQARTEGHDPRTGRPAPLFNPRRDAWDDHFRWSPTFTRIIGRTATGRATVQALRLNRPNLVRARRFWAKHDLHPPQPPEA
jgi:hypothetical protein